MRRFAFRPLFAALAGLLALTGRLSADLVWTPQGGWRVEGGVLSSMSGSDGKNALDFMNKGRTAEEAGSTKAALKYYATVGKKYPNSVFAAEALYRVGLIREKRQEYYKAFDSFQAMVTRYPNSEKFSQVIGEQYRIASQLFAGKRPRIWGFLPGIKNREKAIEYFETIVHTAPYSDYAPLSLMNA
jgi:outer membrane protein assembly factor BamD